MKHITIFMLSLAICRTANSQTDKTIQKTKSVPVNTKQRPLTLQQQGENNMPVPKLPDLRITSINVKMYNSQSADSSKKFLEISYTIKNDGKVSIALNTIFLEGVIKNDGVKPGSYPGCGSVATTLNGNILNAGEEYRG